MESTTLTNLVVAVCVSCYIIVACLIYSKGSPFCHYNEEPDAWVQNVAYSSAGAFVFSCAIQLRAIIFGQFDNSIPEIRSVLTQTFFINFAGGLASILLIVHPNYCIDSFGVVTFASEWCTWIVCVPLLTYTCLVIDKSNMPLLCDWIAIISNFLMIVFGFLMQLDVPQYVGGIFFALSGMCHIIGLYYIYRSNYHEGMTAKNNDEEEIESTTRHFKDRWLILHRTKKKMSGTLAVLLPVYPLLYCLAFVRVLSDEQLIAGYLILGVIAKGLVAFAAMDSSLTAFQVVTAELDAEVVVNERKRDFMKYVFHEIRIPLNALAMGIDCLPSSIREAKDTTEIFSTVDMSLQYTERALDSYLVMLQLEEGTFRLNPVEIRVAMLFKVLNSRLNERYPNARLMFKFEYEDSLPGVIIGDMPILVNAICSLLGVAAKRNVHGKCITVQVKSSKVEDVASFTLSTDSNAVQSSVYRGTIVTEKNNFLVISFCDNGPHLSDVERKEFFKPYGALSTSDSVIESDPGLSKVIAKAVIKRHGGIVSICNVGSDDNRGVMIEISLRVPEESSGNAIDDPLSHSYKRLFSNPSRIEVDRIQGVPEIPSNTSNASTPALLLAETQVEKYHIRTLVVDDTKSNQKMLQRLLLRAGDIESHCADDGLIALQKAFDADGRTNYDLIFMDYTMPVMNGLESTRLIRAKGYDGCIIAVTGNAMDDDVNAFFDAGADAVICKPMKRDKLDIILGCFQGYEGAQDNLFVRSKIRKNVPSYAQARK